MNEYIVTMTVDKVVKASSVAEASEIALKAVSGVDSKRIVSVEW